MELHPLLSNVSCVSLERKCGTPENARAIFEHYKCLPTKQSLAPLCPEEGCGQRMEYNKDASRKFGFRWKCDSRSHNQGQSGCTGSYSASKGTFFERTKLPVTEILILAGLLLDRRPVTEVVNIITTVRKDHDRPHPNVSSSTANHYYQWMREGNTPACLCPY
jgi:hypothetical protein